jgi:putative oxidoreductase
MVVHGWQKLSMGPANVGQGMLASLGVPLPIFMGYVVTFTEFFGGILLIVGLLSRLAAIALTIDLVVAMLLVSGLGQLESSLIAGFLVVLLAGPGKLSLDYALGIEGDVIESHRIGEHVRERPFRGSGSTGFGRTRYQEEDGAIGALPWSVQSSFTEPPRRKPSEKPRWASIGKASKSPVSLLLENQKMEAPEPTTPDPFQTVSR